MAKKKKETKKKEKAKEVKQELTIEQKFAELNDKHLRLFAEFENFKKRTAKERMDLYKTAGESVLTALLPVLDDFERSINCLLYTSPSPRDISGSRMPSSA